MLEQMVFIDENAQARDNKLTIEDMAGGTFTISNVSNRSEESLPLISDSSPGRCLRLFDGHTNYQLAADWYSSSRSLMV